MKIIKPTLNELKQCFEIEKSYELNDMSNNNIGFFLPGATFNLYENLYKESYIRIIKNKETVIAFVIVIPPKNKIVENLLTGESIILCDCIQNINLENAYWIAKIAVKADYRLQGLAKSLYKQVQKDFSNHIGFTATAIAPVRNFSSEKLHKSLNFKKIGMYITNKKNNTFTSIVWQYN